MTHLPLLSIVNFLPLAGALLILAIRGNSESMARNARAIAIATTVANLIVALVIWARFDGSSSAFQFVEQAAWLGQGLAMNGVASSPTISTPRRAPATRRTGEVSS